MLAAEELVSHTASSPHGQDVCQAQYAEGSSSAVLLNAFQCRPIEFLPAPPYRMPSSAALENAFQRCPKELLAAPPFRLPYSTAL